MTQSFKTGPKISKLMAVWMKKNEEANIIDPACGEANVLSKIEEKIPDVKIKGIEVDKDTAKTAKSKLENGTIERGNFFEIQEEFDAVVLDPPVNRIFNEKEKVAFEGSSRWGSHQFFTIKAINDLKTGGSFAILLPTNSFEKSFLDRILENCSISRTISVPNGKFESLDYTLILGRKTENSDKTKIISVESLKVLDETVVYKDSDSLKETRGLSTAEIEENQIKNYDPQKLISFPELLSLRKSEYLTKIETYFNVEPGVRTGNVGLFYLSEESSAKIDEKIQTPLIKNRPSGFKLTLNDLDKKYLDLSNYGEILDEQTINDLDEKGFSNAAEYIRENNSGGALQIKSPQEPPEIVKPSIEQDKFYRVKIDQKIALDDSNYYGLYSDISSDYIDALWKYLNTDIHRRIDSNLQTGSAVSRINKKSLERYQVPNRKLLKKISPKLKELDLTDKHQIREIESVILDEMPEEDRKLLEKFEDKDHRLKWAWLLRDVEYDKFRSKYEDNKEEAKDFLAEKMGPKKAEDLQKTLEISEINPERKRILKNCLQQFEDKNYDIFILSGITQLEGILLEIAVERGWTIQEDKIKKDESNINIKIADLASKFVDGDFSEFIRDEIKPWRNDLAHGKLKTEERTAKIVFGSLAALIQQYERYVEAREN